jgi:ribosomal protein S6--L-glutamate ligase
MHIAILSGGEGWHVRDLQRAARELGHTTVVIDFRRVSAHIGGGKDPLDDFDAVIVRTMPPGSLEQVVFRMDVLHRLYAHGKPVLNPPKALEVCVDKYLTTATLAAANVLVPATIVCQNADVALEAFQELGGDVVVKPLFGAEGRGIVRVSDRELAWRTFRAIERTQGVLYLQKFVTHPGWDLRVFVLRGQELAAMRRYAVDGWRTNVAQGGHAEVTHAPLEAARLAIRAAAAVHTVAAGVDLLPGPDGEWYVLEVNAVPGWKALASVSKLDIAAKLIRDLDKSQLS